MGKRRMMTGWKYVFASVAGTSHSKRGVPCQDSSACKLFSTFNGSTVLAAVAADGAGSAPRAEVGASLACSLFIEEMKTLFEREAGVCDITREFVENWIRRYQKEISLLAEADGLEPRDFASTLLAAVIDLDCAVFIQIGDGAIVISPNEKPDEFCWVFWPQQGQYANTTNFLTDAEAIQKFEHSLVNGRIDEAAVFTDGLQSLALHYESRTAHGPFFRPMFSWLRPGTAGHSADLSSSLASFLDSSRVNDCTDDDKTLILATRREQAQT